MAKVGIVMGSDSDMPVMSKAADILEKLGIDYEPVYAYIWKQNPDIRTNLQLNPVSIYTKFWAVPF